MLTRLRIKNFQLVRNLDLRLDKVTAIIGESEKGKSCIFRAVEAMVKNARGNKFITTGQNFCEVEAWTDRGCVGWYKKAAGSAMYIAGGDMDHSHEWLSSKCQCGAEKFERVEECPRVVKDILGIAPVSFGDELMTVNMAGQFDDPFLIFETGTTVAKVLGKFTRLDEIYAAVRAANKDLGNLKSDEKIRRSDLEGAQARLKQHGDIPDLDPVLDMMEKSVQDLKSKQERISKLETGVREVLAVVERLRALRRVTLTDLTGWPPPALREKVDRLGSMTKDVASVKIAQEKVGFYKKLLERQTEAVTKATEKLAEFKKENNLCPACGRAWA